jgi:hypothetical protein
VAWSPRPALRQSVVCRRSGCERGVECGLLYDLFLSAIFVAIIFAPCLMLRASRNKQRAH